VLALEASEDRRAFSSGLVQADRPKCPRDREGELGNIEAEPRQAALGVAARRSGKRAHRQRNDQN
jgi:hypothetical protein